MKQAVLIKPNEPHPINDLGKSGYTYPAKEGEYFVEMDKDRRWVLVQDAITGIPMGRYFTDEENAQRDAEEAAYEPIRLASLKAGKIAQAVQALAPMLTEQFLSLTEAEQVEFANDFDSVERRLNNGQVEFARAIIASKEPKTENGETVKAALLAGLDSVLALMAG
jgi:hypothetical protein